MILQKDTSLGILGTGHHSVVRGPGTDRWHIAYHRFAIPGGDGTHRETTIDRLEFAADGSIEPVVPTLESVDPVTIVTAGPDAGSIEGSPVTLTGTVSNDANRPRSTAGGEGCVFADPHAAVTTVTCADDGVHTVTLTAGRNADSATVTVVNAAPVVTVPGVRPAPEAPVAVTTEVVRKVTVRDSGGDPLVCTVDWRDGTESEVTPTDGACTLRHRYTTPGVYRPAVTVRDDDGGSATGVLPFVTVHRPRSGHVTGSGWTGTTDFAFSARSGKGGGTAWISTQKGAFTSASLHPALIIGPAATFFGTGAIDGVPGYHLQVTVLDARRDHILIRIRAPRTGKLVHEVHDTGPDGGGITT